MKKRICIIIIIGITGVLIFLLPSLLSSGQTPDASPMAEQGKMNTAVWDIEQKPILRLDGEWEFYWNELLTPEDFEAESHMAPSGYIQVPSLWDSKTMQGKELPVFGCATYRLVLEDIPYRGMLGLKKNDTLASSKIYVNGKEIIFDGIPAKSREQFQFGNLPRLAFFEYDGGSLEILIQVANYEHWHSGLSASVELGSENAMRRQDQLEQLAGFAVITILFTIGFLHLIFFLVSSISGRKEFLLLPFSAFCFLFARGIGFDTPHANLLFFSHLSIALEFKIKTFFFTAAFLTILVIVYESKKGLLSRRMMKGLSLLYGGYLLGLLALPLSLSAFDTVNRFVLLGNTVILLLLLIRATVLFIREGDGLMMVIALAAFNLHSLNLAPLAQEAKAGFISGQFYILLFAFVMIAFLARQHYGMIERWKQFVQRTQEAEFAFLRAQISPHFLYNALNSIAALCREAPDKAEDVVVELSQYLRRSFDFKRLDSMTTLAKEKELLDAYLYIEKIRFGDRLQVEYDIEEGLNLTLPPLVLQPLVENAVRHGLMVKTAGGTVFISIKRQGSEAVFTVRDNGVGLDGERLSRLLEENADKGGIGLWNINRRLKMLYGHGLDISSEQGKGTCVAFSLPLKKS